MRLLRHLSFAPFSFVGLLIYAPLMYFGGSWLCRDDEENFKPLALLFIGLPFFTGSAGIYEGSYRIGFAVCAFTSLATTCLVGNLRLQKCLIVAPVSGIALCATTWIGEAVTELIFQ